MPDEMTQQVPANAASFHVCPDCGRTINLKTTGCVYCLLQLGLADAEHTTVSVDKPISPPGRTKKKLTFGHYRIVMHGDGSPYELGRGGMGVTYKAFDTNLHSYVAVKTIYPPLLQERKLRERFEREARQAAQLRHPNVASIFYLNTSPDHCFYAMELIEGESLEQLVERAGPLEAQFAMEIAAQIADALVAATRLRLVHRDIKPSNVMLARSEEGKTVVKIIDFGVALWLDPRTSDEAERLTQAGLVGTADFASPEQLRHEPVDSRSDIYSLGATLWFVLTGHPPFRGSPGEVVDKQMNTPAAMDELTTQPKCVRDLVGRMLQKDPAARPASAMELRTGIEECRQKLVRTATGRHPKVFTKNTPKPRKLMIGSVALGALVILALLLWRDPFKLLHNKNQPATPIGTAAAEQSIAVLPFHVLTSDEQSRQFAEAVHDEILTSLAHNKRLTVISASSANSPRLDSMTPAEKGATLGVAALMEGSLQRNGRQYRVNARLVEAHTGRTLHARVFDGEENDLFRLQSQIAQDMTAQLQPDRPYDLAKGVPTENMAAYEAYLRGREWERRIENEMGSNATKAAEMYEQAVALDPTFALAEARLASTYARLYWQEDDWNLRQSYRIKAQQTVEQAVKLQPDLPEVHAALGFYYYYGHRDYDHALQEFQLAQKNLPNDSDVALALGLVLRRKAAWDDSIANFLRAARLDPLNIRILEILADTYGGLRRYSDEEQTLARELAIKPNDPELRLHLAYVHFKQNGSTVELRQAVNASDPAHESDGAGFARWDVDMLERKFDQAVIDIQMSAMSKFEVEFGVLPKDLLCALSFWAKGDLEKARPYFERSRLFMEPAVEKNTEGPRLRVALALAYAGLGQKEKAVQQGRLSTEERSITVDPVGGPPIGISLARVYVMVGDKQAALRELTLLLKVPFGLSLSRARIDPCWDTLRDLPEFQRLVQQ